eukprot:TRINITY_DN9152_c0_g1_i1.p2 TRINITY_DN9152_c0_g1~~TRINITY_DN9152_c0_g1_i1.p2  ORF type:complete len:115 (+),score=18.26 TRINITY_DN9152_c0_g1_i1:291-635(+)
MSACCHPTYGLPLAKLIACDAPRAMHNLAELVTSYEGNDLHRELQARLNQLRFRGAELDDDGDVQEGANYLNILDICETVRYLTDGDNDASKVLALYTAAAAPCGDRPQRRPRS